MAYLPPLNGGRVNFVAAGNLAGAAATVSSGTLMLAGGNNVTLSQAGNGVTISGASQSVQTQSNVQGIAAGGVTANTGAVAFNNSNGVSFGLAGNIMTASVAAGAGNFGAGMVAAGNSAGNAGLAASQLALVGGNNITLSQATAAGGSNTVSVVGPTYANANNISFGLNAGTLTASYSQSLQTSNNVQALSAGTAMAATGTVSFANSNGVSFGMNGNTVTASAAVGGVAAPLSRWEYPEDVFTSLQTVPNGSLSIQHMYVPFSVTGTAMKLGGSLSVGTGTSASTGGISASLWMGIYTLSGSTLSLASSGSANNSFAVHNTGATSNNSSVTGMRQLTVPMNVNMAPGEYWVAAAMSTATNYVSNTMAFSIFGNNQLWSGSGASAPVLMPIGSGVAAARDALLFQGIYTAVTGVGPSSMSGGHINNTSASNVMRAAFYNVVYNATY